MSVYDSLFLVAHDVNVLAQGLEGAEGGPMGPEFGKASPIGLLILALMGVAVLVAGWNFHRRFSRFRRRTMFAEDHGIDPFDEEAVDAALKEAGLYDNRKKSIF
ncbi:hypothetical protein [Corynebacterium macginleyi]|uniref:hypothetical protein n=1 Tax=Corynebacterium macginleyi TaxID=38290 RepID=UPI00190A8D93|nr:hypothetical protein [Corynebacterium macginleyi]MBK4138241.1 hypothetical protein [Corynebacterium macginleyi]MBK4147053.1 hypothetical protein [Corynebacterium macginleyi]MBM0261525.1 hypothetical protein [Corynebacterium macginleyi]